MKISVVIPVYNGEKYVSKCLESILKQDYKDFEIVIVDDGSTDESNIILNKYLLEDSRIKILKTENEGANNARYMGYLNSSGEYITFVDCDDWIERNFFKNVKKYLEEGKADVIITGIIREFDETYKNIIETEYGLIPAGIYKDDINILLSNLIVMEKPVDSQELYAIKPNLAGKFFRKEVLKLAKWDIPREIFFGEDGIITYSTI